MADVTSSITATPKLGIRVSDAALSPVPPVEPSISSVRPDTGSLPAVEPVVPCLDSDLERLENPLSPAARKRKTPRPLRISKAKGQAIIELRKKGLSYPKIARRLGLRTGGVRSFLGRRGIKGQQRIRPISAETLREFYCVQGLSMDRIAKRMGLPHSNVEYWMEKHKIARRPLRRYPRHAFSGDDCEKAYMIGFRQGDLHAMTEGLGIRVSSATTHPAQISLFRRIFEKYGHVYTGPCYNRKSQQHQWQMVVALDDSFSFLLPKFIRIPSWIKRNPKAALFFVAGFFDAEGSITIAFKDKRNGKSMGVSMMIANSNRQLLEDIAWILRSYRPRIHLSTSKGQAMSTMDQWKLGVYRRAALESLLIGLPFRHQEKLDKAKIALDVLKGCDWNDARTRIERLWASIEDDVTELAEQARKEIERKKVRTSLS
jgi:hypothetical protein